MTRVPLIGNGPVPHDTITETRRDRLVRMIAKEPGAAEDMIEALTMCRKIRTLDGHIMVDPRELEQGRADIRRYILNQLTGGMAEEIEKAGAMSVKEEPGARRFDLTTIRGQLRVVMP